MSLLSNIIQGLFWGIGVTLYAFIRTLAQLPPDQAGILCYMAVVLIAAAVQVVATIIRNIGQIMWDALCVPATFCHKCWLHIRYGLPATRAIFLLLAEDRQLFTLRNYYYLICAHQNGVLMAEAIKTYRPTCRADYNNFLEAGQSAPRLADAMKRLYNRRPELLTPENKAYLVMALNRGNLEQFRDALTRLDYNGLATEANLRHLLHTRSISMATECQTLINGRHMAPPNSRVNEPIFRDYAERFTAEYQQRTTSYWGRPAAPSRARYNIVDIAARAPGQPFPHQFQRMLSRVSNDETWGRGGSSVIEPKVQEILAFFHQSPEQLAWADDMAAQTLEGCVNQPLVTWVDLCAWVHIAKQQNIEDKLRVTKFLFVVRAIREKVRTDDRVSGPYKPEAANVLIREAHRAMCRQGILSEPCVGLFETIAHEYHDMGTGYSPASWCSSSETQRFLNELLNRTRNQNMENCLETALTAVGSDKHMWGYTAFGQRYINLEKRYAQRKLFIEQAMSLFGGDDSEANIFAQINTGQHADFRQYLKEKCAAYGERELTAQENEAALTAVGEDYSTEVNNSHIVMNETVISWTRDAVPGLTQNQPSRSRRVA